MKRNIGSACGTLLLTLSLAVGAAGCGNNDGAASNDGGVKAQSTRTETKIKNANPKQVAAHLEQLARGVHGVKDANCVVFGSYAIVGIDVEENMERSEVGTLKYAVAEAFRKDPYGIDAVVTADMDIRQRLREIRADMKNGRPLAGFAEEMADIMGRIVPQIPRNIIPPESPENMGTGDLNQLKH
ncbi:YhcN/YlaJ family sporulation lipoprotein [Cohnella sp. GCM10027633]|uniref:YhcN/YlaJ family sporulation lipoprotein n=1 Tax=unclassified Cohnella TaxID=2636738 RepID=UPI00362BD9F8